MSSDDMIFIVKVGTKFFGYNLMLSALPKEGASLDRIINKGWFRFESDSIEEAILKAQNEETEYGYEFVNLQSSASRAKENETSEPPPVCDDCGKAVKYRATEFGPSGGVSQVKYFCEGCLMMGSGHIGLLADGWKIVNYHTGEKVRR